MAYKGNVLLLTSSHGLSEEGRPVRGAAPASPWLRDPNTPSVSRVRFKDLWRTCQRSERLSSSIRGSSDQQGAAMPCKIRHTSGMGHWLLCGRLRVVVVLVRDIHDARSYRDRLVLQGVG